MLDAGKLKVVLRPHSAGAELLELALVDGEGQKAANVIFHTIQDRRGHKILSIRDQNTFDEGLRRKRLMTLAQLFLIHRYRIDSVHYLTPTDVFGLLLVVAALAFISATLLAQARRPVLVIGTDVWADGAEDAALHFVEALWLAISRSATP